MDIWSPLSLATHSMTASYFAPNPFSIVTSTKPDSPQAERSIGGTTYYLAQTTSTTMACEGDKATLDSELTSEIKSIFDSLSST
jgi:hypothetical protein